MSRAEFAARLAAALAGTPQPTETPAPVPTELLPGELADRKPAGPDWVARMFTAHAEHQQPAPAPTLTEPPKTTAAQPDFFRQALDAKRDQQANLAERFGLTPTKKD